MKYYDNVKELALNIIILDDIDIYLLQHVK